MFAMFVSETLCSHGSKVVRNIRPGHETAHKHRHAKGWAERVKEDTNAHDTARLNEEQE
jgi:hypothetical protein